jgi:septal ring factor EnvC (AmiA/AmiB activator)
MAGIEFDRQIFTPAAETQRTQAPKAIGVILLVLALGLAGLVGFKVFTQASQSSAIASANAQVEQLQSQLAESQKRIEELEKHRRPVKAEVAAPVPQEIVKKPVPAKPAYRIDAASALPPQPKPRPAAVTAAAAPPAAQAANANTAAMQSELNANHQAWQATTDRLADVVGVVGQQQNELSETREAVNQLLSQTRRQALSFELQRGNNRMPVGPVTLQLKSVDSKSQRYSVCVYFEDRCIELKDRVLNEVVVFVVSKNGAPLELVATKVLRNQIVGYLEVPTDKQQR